MNLLDVEAVHKFWQSTNPDMKNFVSYCESLEDWCYSNEDMPDNYQTISDLCIELVNNKPETYNSNEIINELIPVLSTLPFGTCLYLLIWLDNATNAELGWGIHIYIQALSLADGNDEMSERAKNLIERLEIILDYHVKCKLFTRGDIFIRLKNAK